MAVALDPVRIGPTDMQPPLSLGLDVLDWTAAYLRQPDGPDTGAPWRYTREQLRFVMWWYGIDEQGRFIYRRGMFRRIKGHGKDPLGSTLCAVELCGPCRFGGWRADGRPVAVPHPSPWIVTAAVSLDQTKNTMRLFPSLFSDDALETYRIDLGKEIIYSRRGLLEAVTSSPRALEGKRPTFTLKNETHHWIRSNDGLDMAEVIARNLTKARGGDARSLAISNAHNPGEGSDAEQDYDAYQAMLTGRGPVDFLYDSVEAPGGVDLADPDQVRAALVAARGDSVWLDLDRHVAEILDPRTREGQARRFYFNQIVAGDDAWLQREAWDQLAVPRRELADDTPVCVGFDGSDTDDWTAIRCETLDGYQFTPRFPDGKPMIWNPAQHNGYIPRAEVNAAVAYLFTRYEVVRFYADPPFFQSEIDAWAHQHGDRVVRWATYRTRQMAEALERFRTDVLAAAFTHDGCPITSQHIGQAHADRRPAGVLIRKDRAVSQNKIDAVLSSTLAHEARLDATAAGWGKSIDRRVIIFS